MSTTQDYVPAAGRDWALPFYDLLSRAMGAHEVHRRLVEQVECAPGERILEVGCGTGNVLAALARAHPACEIVGLDPDPRALERARRKGAAFTLDRGFADALPYPDASVDAVVSAFMYHHLGRKTKPRMLEEAARVLRPGGALHLADFAGPEAGIHGRVGGWFIRKHGFRDNEAPAVLDALHAAGFAHAEVTGTHSPRGFGVTFFRATK